MTAVEPEPSGSLLAFLAASPSPYHAVAKAGRRLVDASFRAVDPARPWPGGSRLMGFSSPIGCVVIVCHEVHLIDLENAPATVAAPTTR